MQKKETEHNFFLFEETMWNFVVLEVLILVTKCPMYDLLASMR